MRSGVARSGRGGITTVQMNAAIAAASPTNDYLDIYKAEAKSKMGTANLWTYEKVFHDVAGWGTDGGGGTGSSNAALLDTTDPVNAVGGVRWLQSGTDVGGSGRLYLTDSTPTMRHNGNAVGFYRAARIRIPSTPGANSNIWAGSFNWRMGVNGSQSTTKWCVTIDNAAGFILSTIDIDTAWHIIRSWYDPVTGNGYIAVDAEAPVALAGVSALFPISAATGFPDIRAAKFGGVVNEQMQINWVLYAGKVA